MDRDSHLRWHCDVNDRGVYRLNAMFKILCAPRSLGWVGGPARRGAAWRVVAWAAWRGSVWSPRHTPRLPGTLMAGLVYRASYPRLCLLGLVSPAPDGGGQARVTQLGGRSSLSPPLARVCTPAPAPLPRYPSPLPLPATPGARHSALEAQHPSITHEPCTETLPIRHSQHPNTLTP